MSLTLSVQVKLVGSDSEVVALQDWRASSLRLRDLNICGYYTIRPYALSRKIGASASGLCIYLLADPAGVRLMERMAWSLGSRGRMRFRCTSSWASTGSASASLNTTVRQLVFW